MDNQWPRQHGQTRPPLSHHMAATLPPLGPLFARTAQRTRDVFAADPDAGLGDDDDRCVAPLTRQQRTPDPTSQCSSAGRRQDARRIRPVQGAAGCAHVAAGPRWPRAAKKNDHRWP